AHQFTQFTPVDGTNAFRNTGVVAWDASDLTAHGINTDTGTYDIKVIRTRSSLSTPPVLGYAKTAATVEYLWDKNGDVNINSLTLATVTAEGSDVDKFLVDSSGVVKYRTGSQILSDVGAQTQGDVLDDLNILGAVGANSEFLVGTGAGTLAWENAATAATSMGLGTGNSPTFAGTTILSATPILVFKDSDSIGDASVGFLEWRDSDNTRLGFFGNSSSGNDDLLWKNESSGGHVGIDTTGAGEFQIFANTVLNNNSITGIGTLGAGAITGTSLTISTTGKINFRDSDISIGSTLDGFLDITADIEVDFFYDNADVGAEVDGQSVYINRRAAEGDDYIRLYVDKDRKGLIGFSGADDLLQLATTGLTVNGALTISTIAAEGSDVDKFLVDSSGVVKYRTGAQVLSDTGALASDGSVALAGAWDMGSQILTNVNIDSGVITGIADLAIGDGGTGQGTAQAAIDALSAVSGATDEHVLTKDTATGNAKFKVAAGGSDVKVGIDVAATAGFLGAANSDGVLRTGTGLSYADGGDFVTLTTNDSAIVHDNLSGFVTKEHIPHTAVFIVTKNDVQTLSNAGFVKIEFDDVTIDADSVYDAVTDYEFTAPAAGVYMFHCSVGIDGTNSADQDQILLSLFKNGTEFKRGQRFHLSKPGSISPSMGVLVNLAANDTIDFRAFTVYAAGAGATDTIAANTYFDGMRIA
ncbi:hypothetical protein LCGC14_1269720, partial [marine sediment metagenome]